MSAFGASFDGYPIPAGSTVAPVNPSVVGNFVSFSNVTGGQQDSGFGPGSFVVLLPTSSARNVIQPNATNVVPLVSKGFGAMVADLLQLQSSAGVVLARVDANGLGSFAGLNSSGAAVVTGVIDAIQLSVTALFPQSSVIVKFLTGVANKDWSFSAAGGVVHNPVTDAGASPELTHVSTRTYTNSGYTTPNEGAFKSVLVNTPSSNAATLRAAALGGIVSKTGGFDGGSDSTSYIAGVYGKASDLSSAGTTFRVIGVIGGATHASNPGIVTTHLMGMLASVWMNTTAVTNMYGVVIASTSTLGLANSTSTPTNAYGLYIENFAGSSLSYSIFTNGGLVHFGDSVDLSSGKNITLLAGNIVTDTTTGTKIGTAVAQKLGFWNATPIVQPSGATQAALAAYVTGAFGLDSNANMQALYNLVVAMRTALVNSGIMKGAA